MVFCLLLAGLLIRTRPYSVAGITALRIASVAIAGWTALVAFIASMQSDAGLGWVLTSILVSGWILIPVMTLLLTNTQWFYCRSKKSPLSVETQFEIVEMPLQAYKSSLPEPVQEDGQQRSSVVSLHGN